MIMSKFTKGPWKVGDMVYKSLFGQRKVEIECPVCFRKGVVALRLGNGEIVELDCGFCSDGIGTPSKGYVNEYRTVPGVERIRISGVTSRETENGVEYEYSSGNYILYDKELFATEEEAIKDSHARSDEYNYAQENRAELIKKDKYKSYSWNAGYHMREAKSHKEKVEYHTNKARICKAKAKGEVV
jgi:hypothetical protein